MARLAYLSIMKRSLLIGMLAALQLAGLAQSKNTPPAANTLLWRVSGKNLSKPSYLFGTMHMLCANDIALSDSLTAAIARADNVYLELDLDNLFEMMGAMTKMKMRNDTTLADLLPKEDYGKVKKFFEEKSTMIPFSMLETYKPLIASSLIMEQQAKCDDMISMEQLVMAEAKKQGVKVKGIETMAYQMSIFDSIPYRYQAQQLMKMIDSGDKGGEDEMAALTTAYRNQQLNKLEEMTRKGDPGLESFGDLLLYNRNRNWVEKLQALMAEKTLVLAVGAGHLPGEKGVIGLLRKAGYKVEPVRNEMIKKRTKTI